MSRIVVSKKARSAKLPLPVSSQATCQPHREDKDEDFREPIELKRIKDASVFAICDGLCMARPMQLQIIFY
jgi:hypothetical protein